MSTTRLKAKVATSITKDTPAPPESLHDLLIRIKNLAWQLPESETKGLLLWMLKEAISRSRRITNV